MKRIVIVSDLQVPYHDEVAVKNLAKFIQTFKPDQVVTIGDEIDLPQISKWEEGRMGSYAQTLDDDRNLAVETLWELGVTDCIRSNHTDRLYNIIMSKVPAFAALPELRFEKFMKFDELGITFHKTPMNIAPNWMQFMEITLLSNLRGVSQPLRQPVGRARALSLVTLTGQGVRPSQRPWEAV